MRPSWFGQTTLITTVILGHFPQGASDSLRFLEHGKSFPMSGPRLAARLKHLPDSGHLLHGGFDAVAEKRPNRGFRRENTGSPHPQRGDGQPSCVREKLSDQRRLACPSAHRDRVRPDSLGELRVDNLLATLTDSPKDSKIESDKAVGAADQSSPAMIAPTEVRGVTPRSSAASSVRPSPNYPVLAGGTMIRPDDDVLLRIATRPNGQGRAVWTKQDQRAGRVKAVAGPLPVATSTPRK